MQRAPRGELRHALIRASACPDARKATAQTRSLSCYSHSSYRERDDTWALLPKEAASDRSPSISYSTPLASIGPSWAGQPG
jgi:hypothetical protein